MLFSLWLFLPSIVPGGPGEAWGEEPSLENMWWDLSQCRHQRPSQWGQLFWGAALGLSFKMPRGIYTPWTLPFFKIRALSLRPPGGKAENPAPPHLCLSSPSPELLPSLLTMQVNILHLGLVPGRNTALGDWESNLPFLCSSLQVLPGSPNKLLI